MVHKAGDKVMVGGEKCEVVAVYGEGAGYAVETPDGTTKKVLVEQVSDAEETEEEVMRVKMEEEEATRRAEEEEAKRKAEEEEAARIRAEQEDQGQD